jgi:hypothetical protein
MGYFRELWTGRKLANSMLSGEFDDSKIGQQFASWFSERAAREEQRQIFVQLTIGLHCPSGIVADRLMHCVMEIWGGREGRFGDMLVQEIDRIVVFDPPKSAQQAEQQRVAKQGLAELESRLRALDAEVQT